MNICSFFSPYFILDQKIRSEGCSERPVRGQNALSLASKPLPQAVSSVLSERWGLTSKCHHLTVDPNRETSFCLQRNNEVLAEKRPFSIQFLTTIIFVCNTHPKNRNIVWKAFKYCIFSRGGCCPNTPPNTPPNTNPYTPPTRLPVFIGVAKFSLHQPEPFLLLLNVAIVASLGKYFLRQSVIISWLSRKNQD